MPATRARTCTSREPSVRPTASKLTGTSRGATSITLTGTAGGAALASSFFCLASPWLQAATSTLRAKARSLMVRTLGGKSRRCARRGAHVPALELDQHAHGELARHLAEQAILAGEMVVDGLLRDAGAARDLIDARGIAMREKGIRRGAQYALAVFNRHWSSPGPRLD